MMLPKIIKTYFMYTIFLATKKVNNEWITERHYYKGDFFNVDLKNDWRFKEIPGRRKQLEFIGYSEKFD